MTTPLRRAASGRRGRSSRRSGAGRRDRPAAMSRSGPRPAGAIRSGSTSPTAWLRSPGAITRELEFIVGDAEDLPLEDGGFDAVVGNFVINHLPQPDRGLAEAARVLVAGGHLAFSAWQRPDRMLIMGLIGRGDRGRGSRGGRASRRDPVRAGRLPVRRPGRVPWAARGRRRLAEVARRAGRARASDRGRRGALARLHGRERARLDVRSALSPTPCRRRIREALDAVVEPYRAGDVLEVPGGCDIASGRKP